jgi:hypothetical protein
MSPEKAEAKDLDDSDKICYLFNLDNSQIIQVTLNDSG